MGPEVYERPPNTGGPVTFSTAITTLGYYLMGAESYLIQQFGLVFQLLIIQDQVVSNRELQREGERRGSQKFSQERLTYQDCQFTPQFSKKITSKGETGPQKGMKPRIYISYIENEIDVAFFLVLPVQVVLLCKTFVGTISSLKSRE